MVKKWVMNQDDLNRLLAWLHPDCDKAARKYEEIRRRLIKMFESRGCTEAEVLTDDTFDRVARKVPEIAPTFDGEREPYFYAVARNVLHEWLRRPKPPAPLPMPPPD